MSQVQKLHCRECQAELDPAKNEKLLFCTECGQVRDEDDDSELDTKYECSSCGNEFFKADGEGQGNTCPECHKWAAVVAHNVCVDCDNGEEVEKHEVIECPECGEYTSVEEAEEVEVDDESKPKSVPFKVPWKKGQKFVLAKPYTHIEHWYEGKDQPCEFAVAIASIFSIDRERRKVEMTVSEHNPHSSGDKKVISNGWPSHLTMNFTVEELQQNWTPVTSTTDYVESHNLCERCGKLGAELHWDIYQVVCNECYAKVASQKQSARRMG